MKILFKIFLLFSLLPTICKAGECGDDYHHRQHIRIYFNDDTVVRYSAEYVGNYTEFRRVEECELRYKSVEIPNEEYDVIWDYVDGEPGTTFEDMQKAYKAITNAIKDSGHYAEYTEKTDDKYNDENYCITNVRIKRDEIKRVIID